MLSLPKAFPAEKRMGNQPAFGIGKEKVAEAVCIGRPGLSATFYVRCQRSGNGTILSPYTGLHGV